MRSLKQKVDEKKLNEMALLRKIERFKGDVKPLECENKVLRETSEGVSDSAVQGAGTYSKVVEQLFEAQEPQYIELAKMPTRRFGARCYKEMSELQSFTVKNFGERAE